MRHRTKPCTAKTLISDTFGLSGPERLCTLKHIKRSSTLALGKDASSASARTAWRIASIMRVHKPYAKAATSSLSRHLPSCLHRTSRRPSTKEPSHTTSQMTWFVTCVTSCRARTSVRLREAALQATRRCFAFSNN